MKAKITVLLLISALMLGALSIFVSADEGEAVEATIDAVYGGRNGIITMTFDDGNYDTTVTVDELLETYGLRATVMMLASKVKNGAGKWADMFSTGRIAVQNHSMTHIGFRKNNDEDVENLNEETYKYEILDSADVLETVFPEYDMVSYAIPYGGWCDEAAAVAASKYYMIRSTYGGVQSLDPGFELNVNGSWSNLKCVSINTSIRPNQLTDLKAQVDEAALGGWLCTITHHVGSMEASELSYDEADELFTYISDYEKMGMLWVTDTESATKYVRERQNATLSAKKVGNGISLKATLAEMTEDGLPLDGDVFDYPLTVKVKIDEEIDTVYYYDGCVKKTAEVFTDGVGRYARVELVPNGEELMLYPAELDVESLPHDYAAATCTTVATCNACGHTVGDTEPHDYADATCTLPRICNGCGEYDGEPLGHDYTEATCTAAKTCTRCDKVSGKPKKHDYADATCTEPKTCKTCGGTEGAALGHVVSFSSCADAKCARCKNMIESDIAHDYADATCEVPKTCKVCGVTDGVALEHIFNEATCISPKICEGCGITEGEPLEHTFNEATCTAAKTCGACGHTEGEALGHNYTAPTCTTASVCERCDAVGDAALGHSVAWEDNSTLDSHREYCTRCNEAINENEAHTDGNSDGKCDGCAKNLDTGDGLEPKEEGNYLVFIIIGAAMLALGGGAVAFAIIRKKRT